MLLGIGLHLLPEFLHHSLAGNLDKFPLVIQDGIAKIIDLNAPGNHLQGCGDIGLGGHCLGGNGTETIGIISRGTVLGTGNTISGKRFVDFSGQFHLNPLGGCLNAVGGAII